MGQLTPWVRQYTLRDLLDESFDLYKERVTTLLLATVIPLLLVVLYIAVMRLFVFPGHFTAPSFGAFSTIDNFVSLAHNRPWLLYTLGLCGVVVLGGQMGYITQCRIITRHALGQPVSLRDSIRLQAKPNAGLVIIGVLYAVSLCVALIAAGIADSVLGLLTLIVTSIGGEVLAPAMGHVVGFFSVLIILGCLAIATVPFFTAPVSLAIDHTGPFTALGQSFRIASSNFRPHTLALMLTAYLPLLCAATVFLVASLIVYLAQFLSPILSDVLESLLLTLGISVISGLIASLQALVYLDGRCRTENYDLHLLAQHLGMEAQLDTSLPTATAQPTVHGAYPNYAATPTQPVMDAPTVTTPAMAFPDYSAPPPPLPAEEEMADEA